MRVPINAPATGDEEARAAASVLRAGALSSAASEGGRHVRLFESRAASFTGAGHAVAVNSGTAALQAALLALGIGPGDEVLLPSFTFVATANAVLSAGARPVFADIREGDHTIDPDDCERRITGRTRAIIPVHLYGNVADVERLGEISRRHGLRVIEDAAQALGSTYRGRHAGTFFDAGCYSLYPAKVATAGEGGLVVTGSKRLRDRLRMVRNHGMARGHDTRTLGLNLRLPEISAAVAAVQMKRLPGFLRARRKNAEYLSGLLGGLGLGLPEPREGERVNWYLYTVSAGRRNRLLRELNNAGIGAAAYYSTPVHRMPLYRQAAGLPVTERAASRVLSVPVHPGVSRRDLDAAAKILRGAA